MPDNRFYCWVVLGILTAGLAGCSWGDIGAANDMASEQEQSRINRPIPKATEMPPGLGEDLPSAPATHPMTSTK